MAKQDSPKPPDLGPDESRSAGEVPYDRALERVVEKIKDEPLLFVLGVGALLVGLVALGGSSPDLRFVVVVFALLAFTVIVGHYLRETLEHRTTRTGPTDKQQHVPKLGSTKARQFWRSFAADELQVVLGRHTEFSSFEPTGFVGLGNAIGLAELRAFFAANGLPDFIVSYADRLAGDALATNLLLIGGPDSNSVTREVVPRIRSKLQFGDPSRHQISLYDSATGTTYKPRAGPGWSNLTLDCGLIIRTANPFAPDRHLLVIAGSFGYGTWAAIRFSMSRRFLEHPAVTSRKSFECLIETDIVRETPQDVRPLVIRRLEGNGLIA